MAGNPEFIGTAITAAQRKWDEMMAGRGEQPQIVKDAFMVAFVEGWVARPTAEADYQREQVRFENSINMASRFAMERTI